MRWKRGAGSGNVEDRRGRPGGRAALPVGGGIIGIIVTLAIVLLGGGGGYDVGSPFEQFPAQQQPGEDSTAMENAPSAENELVDFVSFVVGDLESFWQADFSRAGREFSPSRLVLFRQGVDTGCGAAPSQTGPFYCPADQQIYVDLGFFRDLAGRFNAPGDFAQAYVLAHEYGHHIQTITRVTQQVDTATRENPDQRNALSVRVELQADCLAGVWAHSTYERGLLERGRPRGGPDRRRGGRRRPHPGRGDGSDQPRDVHARHRGTARRLVQARLRRRRRDRLRHLLPGHLTRSRKQSVKRLGIGREGG